jgi:hypothetical protein
VLEGVESGKKYYLAVSANREDYEGPLSNEIEAMVKVGTLKTLSILPVHDGFLDEDGVIIDDPSDPSTGWFYTHEHLVLGGGDHGVPQVKSYLKYNFTEQGVKLKNITSAKIETELISSICLGCHETVLFYGIKDYGELDISDFNLEDEGDLIAEFDPQRDELGDHNLFEKIDVPIEYLKEGNNAFMLRADGLWGNVHYYPSSEYVGSKPKKLPYLIIEYMSY